MEIAFKGKVRGEKHKEYNRKRKQIKVAGLGIKDEVFGGI